MKNAEEISKKQSEHLMSECQEQHKKSLGAAVAEIKDICLNREEEYFRIAALQRLGYTISYEWIKGNEVGRLLYMKRKKEYRVQITPAVLHGDFTKAYVVILSEKEYDKNMLT
jgi:hypothetical protein